MKNPIVLFLAILTSCIFTVMLVEALRAQSSWDAIGFGISAAFGLLGFGLCVIHTIVEGVTERLHNRSTIPKRY